MIAGAPTFPGMKDSYDQLDKIFRVLGTPTENTWSDVSKFTQYDLKKFVMYEKLSSLSLAIPKLSFIPHAEDLASQFLQMCPHKRISAQAAMKHEYFMDLPPKIHDLPDASCVFNIPGLKLLPEMDELLLKTASPARPRPRIRTTVRV